MASAINYMPDNNRYDPGNVNVHQFYPLLECNFTKHLANTDEESFRPLPENSGSQNICKGSTVNISQNLPEDNKRGNDGEEDKKTDKTRQKSPVDDTAGCSVKDGKDVFSAEIDKSSIQDEVFSTAVNEESLEAAKLRSQQLFCGDWNSATQPRHYRQERIVRLRANEHYQMAMRMKEENNLMGTISSLSKAINLRPEDPVLYAERGEAYLSLCDFQSAILNYRKACLLTDNKATHQSRLALIYYFQGQTLFDQRLFSEALSVFYKVSEMVPENFAYWMRIITCLAALQRHDDCLNLVNQRLQNDKENPDLYILRARLHEIFANLTSCYQDVKTALTLNPNHQEGQTMMTAIIKTADANKNLALQQSIMGKDKQALQKISLAIQTNPSVADYHVLRGTLYRKIKDFNSAVDDFLLALNKCGHKRSDPIYRNSQRQLLLTFNDFAVECFNKGSYEEAISLLSKALQEEMQEKSLYVNRGDCFYKKKELTFALEDYLQALDLEPDDPAIKFRLALVYNEFGVSHFDDKNYTDAEAQFTLALEYSPLVGQIYVSRSRARYMLGDLAGAKEDCLWGLLLSPFSGTNTSTIARLFPGKSMAEILNSPAANAVEVKVQALIVACCNKRLSEQMWNDLGNTMGSPSGAGPEAGQTSFDKTWNQEFLRNDNQPCTSDRELFVKEVREKKRVESRVKDALFNRGTLHYDGPHLLPLPPLIPLTLDEGSLHADRQGRTTNSGHQGFSDQDRHSKEYKSNWKHFRHTVGAVNHVV